MGRTDAAVAVATGAPEAAAAAEARQKEGGPPGGEVAPAPPPPREEDARLAKRRARVDAACAAVFRTRLLRQFAALLYKNR